MSTSPDMTTVFQAGRYSRIYRDKEQPSEKKNHTNQGSSFLVGCFGNNNNIRPPIKLRRERKFQNKTFLQEKTHPLLHQQHQSYQTDQKKNNLFFHH